MKGGKAALWWMVASALSCITGCESGRHLITASGIHALRMGGKMPPPGTGRFGGHRARDTFELQGGYRWRVLVMRFRRGNVYLEEDFYGSGHLARIRIHTPELALRNGLRVGMKVCDLEARASDWTVVPMPDYSLVDLYSSTMPGIHFLVHDPNVPMDANRLGCSIQQLAPESPIRIIVVF